MTRLIVDIYDWLRLHRAGRRVALVLLTVLMAVMVARQTYKEDISDFLPLDGKAQQAMQLYQDIAGADRIAIIISQRDTANADPDKMVQVIDKLAGRIEQADTAGIITDLMTQVDGEQFEQLAEFVYANIPYFLTDDDHARIDSMLAQHGAVDSLIAIDKQLLTLPVSGLMGQNMGRDPLGLFTPTVMRLQRSAPAFEQYDGYIFSPDMTRAFVTLTSPYGNSETEQNAALLQLLRQCADEAVAQTGADVDISMAGGPVIAVDNARQIKADSLLAVALAMTLIVALLWWVFRHVRGILLIVIAIAWGWLVAMAALSLVHDQVSIIVVGISSVILGIAVNYPLHLIAHLRHEPDMRTALKQLVMPLVVGNVTTVGAFLALVPLQSVALRDLGLFSAFLLVGTIVFVIIFLPHMARAPRKAVRHTFVDRMGEFAPESRRWLVAAVALLTVVLGCFSLRTSFDADISHINYMTDSQRRDMALFQQMLAPTDSLQTVYVVSTDSTREAALARSERIRPQLQHLQRQGLAHVVRSDASWMPSAGEQRERLARWSDMVERHATHIIADVRRAAAAQGFTPEAFDEFYELLGTAHEVQPVDYFEQLEGTVCAGAIVGDTAARRYQVVDVLTTTPQQVAQLEQAIGHVDADALAFDVASMNSTIATRLSDNFNYIGWACAAIVFLFLWFSLGNIELALLSFLPMAVSWVWILGIMALLGVQFNVVNVILATFIFGQGDDYTIFMTEGSQYEYAYGRKMLASYKHSIILSALIMFIGIGTLIVAQHPALRSLAQVIIVGMCSVVLMAYLFPPLIFNWLVQHHGRWRNRPVTLRGILGLRHNDDVAWLKDWYRYRGVEIYREVKSNLKRTDGYRTQLQQLVEQRQHTVVVDGAGWGELPLLLARRHPDIDIIAIEPDDDKRAVIAQCAAQLNAHITVTSDAHEPNPHVTS